MKASQPVRSSSDVQTLIERLLPGTSPHLNEIRTQVANFSRNLLGKAALLIGPIGSGKSTIARIMAFTRYLHLCTDAKRKQLIETLQYDGPFRIDKKHLDFYEELNLTGLVPTLAQAQLFGVARGAATGVDQRPGIFEQAMYGHQAMDKPSMASMITGGVVFLDEIGDLPAELQPILLSVLTGTQVFRVGGEGDHRFGYTYKGSVIAATWKDISDGSLRADLLSRLSDQIICLPSLNERKNELEEIIVGMEADIRKAHQRELERLSSLRTDFVSRTTIENERNRALNLRGKSIEVLKEQDWNELGNLRGLRQILLNSFYTGKDIGDVINQLSFQTKTHTKDASVAADILLQKILAGTEGRTLTDEIKNFERETRAKLTSRLLSTKQLLSQVAQKFSLSEAELRRKLENLIRDRSNP